MFEELGFYKEYYLNGKFIGIVNCEKDREIIGYNGRRNETIQSEIILSNKRKIKAGLIAQTIIYPLSGKQIN